MFQKSKETPKRVGPSTPTTILSILLVLLAIALALIYINEDTTRIATNHRKDPDLWIWSREKATVEKIAEQFNMLDCDPILEHLPPGHEALYVNKANKRLIIYTWKIHCRNGSMGFANDKLSPDIVFPQNVERKMPREELMK